jgi:TonB family protein
VFALLLLIPARAQQNSGSTDKTEAEKYPNTPDGLRRLIDEILQAVKSKDSAREGELIHGLLMPVDSTWFTDVYGPGFGSSLAAAYRRAAPNLEQEIRTVYEGNAHHGWVKPKIFRYSDPETVNAPLDHFLNCMNEVEPLYTTAFQGNSQMLVMPLKTGSLGQGAGDLDGYFVYEGGGFRFIPLDILMKLPNERPVRISLDMKIMESKLLDKAYVRMPAEAIKKRISGRVVVELILDVGGKTKELKVVEGGPILSAAVLDAVKQWRFAPTQLDGDPVEVDIRIPFTFEIH